MLLFALENFPGVIISRGPLLWDWGLVASLREGSFGTRINPFEGEWLKPCRWWGRVLRSCYEPWANPQAGRLAFDAFKEGPTGQRIDLFQEAVSARARAGPCSVSPLGDLRKACYDALYDVAGVFTVTPRGIDATDVTKQNRATYVSVADGYHKAQDGCGRKICQAVSIEGKDVTLYRGFHEAHDLLVKAMRIQPEHVGLR